MRSVLLLLLLSLMTGCMAESKVKGCLDGWVEFTCNYPIKHATYTEFDVVNKKKTQEEEKMFLHHDTVNKEHKAVINHLGQNDFGKYQCRFYQEGKKRPETTELDLARLLQTDGCQGPFTQTAYEAAKTTITCDYPGNKYKSSVKFFCKEKDSVCEDILSTASPRPNGTFTLTETNRGFSISISQVSSDDAGVYWCGVKPKEGHYRASLRKIQLEVEAINKNFTRSLTIGQDFTYWCTYPNGASKKKFICKGEDPSICQRLVSTAQPNMNTGKFSMRDDTAKGNISITVRDVTPDDAGTYWCGAESTHKTHSNQFFHRFLMTVVPPPTSPAASTQPTTAPAESDVGSPVVITVIVCVAVLLLLFVLSLILIYKRFSHSNNSRSGSTPGHNKEDFVYDEIQEHATASSPNNPSDSLHYSTINFQKRSDKDGAEVLMLKSGSACEYSTVKFSQSPICSTVKHPSTSTLDPLYSTVNKPG